jgi:hypothetical protein
MAAVVAALALVPVLVLAGSAHGLALLVYLLFLAALVLALLVARLCQTLPRAASPLSSRSQSPHRDGSIAQFEKIRQALEAAEWTEEHLHESLRPIVREIVAARLLRRHGIDLEHAPARAHAIVGDGYAWDLARPDRRPPALARSRGWSQDELDKLLDELEAL